MIKYEYLTNKMEYLLLKRSSETSFPTSVMILLDGLAFMHHQLKLTFSERPPKLIKSSEVISLITISYCSIIQCLLKTAHILLSIQP